GRGGRVTALRFTASPKGPKTLLDLRMVSDPIGRGPRTTPRDPHTIDLLENLTDAERGPDALISPEAKARAIEMIGAESSLDPYLEQWAASVRGRRVQNPDRSFINWLDLKLEAEGASESSLL